MYVRPNKYLCTNGGWLLKLFHDGQDISDLLMQQNLAVPYDGGTKTKEEVVPFNCPPQANS